MKRYLWLLFALGMPLSSPLACGGDGCLRNSDCPSAQACRAGQCQLKELPDDAQGGAGSEDPGTGGAATAGSANNAGSAGKGGAAGNAGNAGSPGNAGGDASGGDAGAGGAAGDGGNAGMGDGGDANVSSGGTP
jgi:hypothetical protein